MTIKLKIPIRTCLEDQNSDARAYNNKLTNMLPRIQAQLHGSKLFYSDIYKPVIELIQNPAKHGFVETKKGCCGTGMLEAAILCNMKTPLCRNASDISWGIRTSAPIFPSNLPIPVDLFLSKKHRGLPRGVLGFADSDGNVVYKVQSEIPELPSAAKKKKSVLDSLGNTLITLYRYTVRWTGGAWEGFKGGELIFKGKRTEKTLTRYEFEVFFSGESNQDSKFELKVKGSPFQRANTIYNGDSIVAQGVKLLMATTHGYQFVNEQTLVKNLISGMDKGVCMFVCLMSLENSSSIFKA
ncbi:hypothetical protein ACFE04_015965 [Oxalis oulophora]